MPYLSRDRQVAPPPGKKSKGPMMFILPLLIALVMYLGVEAKAKALRVKKTPA